MPVSRNVQVYKQFSLSQSKNNLLRFHKFVVCVIFFCFTFETIVNVDIHLGNNKKKLNKCRKHFISWESIDWLSKVTHTLILMKNSFEFVDYKIFNSFFPQSLLNMPTETTKVSYKEKIHYNTVIKGFVIKNRSN